MKKNHDESFFFYLLVVFLFGQATNAQLSNSYYFKTCPDAEGIIQRKMSEWFTNDTTLAPSIIRLHFHDCSVRGCDASVLLKFRGSERSAEASKSLRGFDVINDMKSELEKQCPRTVSCADILSAAARDATVLLGGPFWEVTFGRKDGRVSLAKEADELVPRGRESVTALIDLFETKLGLNVLDLVTLSGSHTIGRSTCSSYKYSRSIKASKRNLNPVQINAAYANRLKSVCGKKKKHKKNETYVDLDASTPRIFDTRYYSNLGNNMGLLTTDQALYKDPRTFPFVSVLAVQPDLFFSQFSASMVKLANVVVTSEASGDTEVRLHCDFVNSY